MSGANKTLQKTGWGKTRKEGRKEEGREGGKGGMERRKQEYSPWGYDRRTSRSGRVACQRTSSGSSPSSSSSSWTDHPPRRLQQ